MYLWERGILSMPPTSWMIFAFDPVLEHYFYILYKNCSNNDIQVESQAE